MTAPEERARETIDAKLAESGWIVQSQDEVNLAAGPRIAIGQFSMASGTRCADYLLLVNVETVGVVETRREGRTRIYSQMRLSCVDPCQLNEVQLSDEEERQGSSGCPPGLSIQYYQ